MEAEAPRLLAFDTSTETLSVALTVDGQLRSAQGPGGAQASATLIPIVLRLLREAGVELASLHAIVFGRGPGSFTGLRTACAVAQGLGFGAGVPLLPVDTLHAVAEEARFHHGAQRVLALLDARMGELYAAAYTFDGSPADHQARLLAPEALRMPPGFALAGNVFAAYAAQLPAGMPRHEALPTAQALLRLAPALLAAGHAVPAADALPLYVRDKVALTTEERAQLHRDKP